MGYIIGPRINAGGRVGKCSHGANLLLNENPKNSFQLASELDQYNKERQLLEKDLLKNVLKNITNLSDPVLILSGNNWHEGVIGIIAARIKEKYNKPTIIISVNNLYGKDGFIQIQILITENNFEEIICKTLKFFQDKFSCTKI